MEALSIGNGVRAVLWGFGLRRSEACWRQHLPSRAARRAHFGRARSTPYRP